MNVQENPSQIGPTLPEIRQALIDLRNDYDGHIHDGSSSRLFQTIQANTVSSQTVLVRKTSYSDTTNGLWMGIVDGLMKLSLGNASSYLQWSGSSLSIVGSITATSGTIGGWTIGATTLTGGGITLSSAGTIKTASSGARVEITNGNDINLYEDTTSSGGTVSGNAAEINFIKESDTSKYFVLRKRVGKDNSSDNVLELFSIAAAASSRFNAFFFGGSGDGNYNYVDSASFYINKDSTKSYDVLNGSFGVGINLNSSRATHYSILAQDARLIYANSSKSGVVSLLVGSGTDGFGGIGYYNGSSIIVSVYSDSTKVNLGLSMIPDADNSYDIGSSSFRIRSMYVQTNQIYRGITQPVNYFGYCSGTTLSITNSSFSLSNPSTGNYTVTHNLGTTSYVVLLTALRASGAGAYHAKVASKNSNDFKVIVFDETGTAQDGDFMFSLLKP